MLDGLIANCERDAVIGALFEPAVDKVNFRPAEMTEGDIIVYTVATLFGETTNGGLIQYFTNQSGSWAHECGPSLRRIGADKYADIVEACIQRFTDAESAHEPQWELDLDDYIDDHTMPFEDIEEAFWEYYRANEDELLELLYSYIRDNRDVFAGTTNGA